MPISLVAVQAPRPERLIRTIKINDTVGFRTFGGAIQYGLVVAVELRGTTGRAARRDEIHVLLRHSGRTVLIQRWRIVERYRAALTPGPDQAEGKGSK